jgi:hypothetical protein
VATRKVIEHMKQQVDEPLFSTMWKARFPDGQIYQPQSSTVAAMSPVENQFVLEGRWIFRAVECGHSDTYGSTVLWVPDLKLAVCGDVVYGQVHQMLYEANTKAKREEWIQAIEKVEKLGPVYVVPGHKQAEEMDGTWHLAATKKYIQDFEAIVASDPKDPGEVFAKVMELYPERFNPAPVRLSSAGVFLAKESSKHNVNRESHA